MKKTALLLALVTLILAGCSSKSETKSNDQLLLISLTVYPPSATGYSSNPNNSTFISFMQASKVS